METLETYLTTLRTNNIEIDQTQNFVNGGYVALPWALSFHRAARETDQPNQAVWLLAGGARGPGKSHMILAQVGLDDCQRAPGSKWLFLRKVKYKAQESMEDLVRRIFAYTPHDYKPGLGRVVFPNGSRILIGGFQNDEDIDNYIGIEYDGIAIEELSQLTWRKIMMLLGSLRTSRQDWRPRLYASTNPGGIGHNDVKQMFIQPWRDHTETRTRFFPGTYHDNPFLNQEYRDYLESLSGPLGKAWRDGDWDVFEGMAFPNWSHELHVIKPFPIPDHWLKWEATDEGYAKPWCCLWMTKDPGDEAIYVYREAYQTNLTTRQQAQRIKDLTPVGEQIAYNLADPSMWARQTADDIVTTSAQVYEQMGIPMMKANNDRILGKRKIDDLLAVRADGKSRLRIFNTCANLIRTLPVLPFDETHAEDVDTDAEDHAYDTLRYGVTNVNVAEEPAKKKKKIENPWLGISHL